MLLDAESLALVSRIDDVVDAVAGGPLEGHVQAELTECTVELATGVCADLDEARRELLELRRGLGDAIRPLGVRAGGAGTHPFSLPEQQRITRKDRYRWLIEQLQYVAREEIVFGMHVHVAVPDTATAIGVLEGLVIELPVLLALSANSPFWRGDVSGLASSRTAVFAGFPRSGLPPRFSSYDDYLETVDWLEATGTIADYTRLWWDVRPHPRLGTIELRVCDVQFDADYALGIAAYVQALVASLLDELAQGRTPVTYHRQLVAENKWLAARYGLDAPLIDLATGRRATLAAGQLARRRLRQLTPYAKELGSADALAEIDRVLSLGTGAMRQLRVYNANRDMLEVMRELADLTEVAVRREA